MTWFSPWAGLAAFVVLAFLVAPAWGKMLTNSRRATQVACITKHNDGPDRILPLWKLIAETHVEVLACKEGEAATLMKWLLVKLPNGGKGDLKVQEGENGAICFIGAWTTGVGSVYVTMRPSFLTEFTIEVFGDEQHETTIRLAYHTALRKMVNLDAYYRGEP